jgi:hypothetical protein
MKGYEQPSDLWGLEGIRSFAEEEPPTRWCCRDTEVIHLFEQLADLPVQFHHRIGVETVAALALPFGREVSPDVTAGGVVPKEERLVRFHGVVDEVERAPDEHWFYVLHVGLGCRIHIRVRRQWIAVPDSLHADLASARIRGRIIDIGVRRLWVLSSPQLHKGS